VDVPKVASKIAAAQDRALMMAMSALQHGRKITDQQKKMIDELTPERRLKIQEKTKEVRSLQ